MLNDISKESKKSINTSILIWFTMFSAQFVYLLVCFILLEKDLYKSILEPHILKNILFMNIDIQTSIYILSILVLIIEYSYFKKTYSKLVLNTQAEDFKNTEEEFKYFKEKYISLMFICLAIFESIVILGIIVFLTTLNFYMMLNLVGIAMIGFLLVIPNKNKFNYSRI